MQFYFDVKAVSIPFFSILGLAMKNKLTNVHHEDCKVSLVREF